MNDLQMKTEYLNLKRSLFDQYYSFLNDKQKESVYTINGPLLILAGAGSGKTTVLVNRLAHIIRYGDAYYTDSINEQLSENIIEELKKASSLSHEELGDFLTRFSCDAPKAYSTLAITFTNKAANEIKQRIAKIFGEESSELNDIWAGTFHSVCVRLLRYYGANFRKDFGICDADESKKVLASIMKKLNIDEKQLQVKDVQNTISRAKDELQTPDDFENEVSGDYKKGLILKIYNAYQAQLQSSNLLDFDDIIMQTVFLLRDNPEILNKVSGKFRYVSIDEYQDTNHAQFVLAKLLSSVHNNIMVVGDEDQSIYKFRGATITNILSFQKNFKNAKLIKLEENYRSTKYILDAANAVISNNESRIGKVLWTENNQGEKIHVRKLKDQYAEANDVLDMITEYHRKGGNYKDIAILYRMNSLSRTFENLFSNIGIPYRVLCGLSFYERAEVKDLIAYLSVINNPDDSIHLKRIINVPKRGIGNQSVGIAETIAISEGCSIFDVLKRATNYKAISTASAKAMVAFTKLIEDFQSIRNKNKISMLINTIIIKTCYQEYIDATAESVEKAVEKTENIQELVSNAAQYENMAEIPTLSEFLESISLSSEVDKYDETVDCITLMTIHSAKGLEFPIVVIPAMEEGIFPGFRSFFDPKEIEEERRLAYVGYTRAKKALYLTTVHERTINGASQMNKASRFIEEISPDYIDLYVQPELNFFNKSSFQVEPELKMQHSSPGYMMRQERLNKVSPFSPVTKPSSASSVSQLEKFEVGDRIKHSSFGLGTITKVSKMGGDILYDIDFDVIGNKKLMATYARLERA